ncbi:replicative DNA helicase [Salicola sp. Rm-C-2C1-2]|uniref:replicative DNA helicase n=1 Tax=Salicola sp. Rm-C-2C1-2 TaxID=3141321 RepID=UPI0032E496E0
MAQEHETGKQASRVKVPPHSIEAEQAVLGGLMLDNAGWELVEGLVTPGDFYRSEHRLIFHASERLIANDKPLDMVTVGEWLEQAGDLDACGGLEYLGQLVEQTPGAANLRSYAEIVKERSILRQLVEVSGHIADSAFNPQGRSSAEILDAAESEVFQIAEHQVQQSGGPRDINPILRETLERIESLFETEGGLTGLTSGFKDLDDITSGWQPSDLVIVAARPSMGKTAFAMNLVENMLMASDKGTLVFSMEMPADAIVMRMLSSIGRIDQTRIRNGNLEQDDWPRLTSAISLLKDRPLYIDDTPSLSPTDMRSRARRIAREMDSQGTELGMVMVDYLQLMRAPGNNEGRTAEISEISRGLKGLAKELNCPVIALSQLNRSLEQRPNKRPVNSDLRESGAIEQDADVIAFIYRDEVYNEDSTDKGIAEIIIGKQRNGPVGSVRLAFLGQYTKFEDLAYGDYGGDY